MGRKKETCEKVTQEGNNKCHRKRRRRNSNIKVEETRETLRNTGRKGKGRRVGLYLKHLSIAKTTYYLKNGYKRYENSSHLNFTLTHYMRKKGYKRYENSSRLNFTLTHYN